MQKKNQSGFTLIELMIVVAIIGILAAVALPAYQTYTAKAKFSEVILATSGIKTAVEICATDTADLTQCDDGARGSGWSITSAGASGYVASVTTTNGEITATAVSTDGLTDDTYILSPSLAANGQVSWIISSGSDCITTGLC